MKWVFAQALMRRPLPASGPPPLGPPPLEPPPLEPMLPVQMPARDWHRLSARMLLIHPITEGGRALTGLAAIILFGSRNGAGVITGLAALAVVVLLALARWLTTSYRITATQLELRRGLLRKRTSTASLDRVRTVDVTAHALHRLLGLARVVIGTGVSDRKGRSEFALDGLPAVDAARLRQQLLHHQQLQQVGGPSGPPIAAGSPSGPFDPSDPSDPQSVTSWRTDEVGWPPEAEELLLAVPPGWVRYAPFTLSGAITALTVAAFGWRVFSDSGENPSRFGVLRPIIDHLRGLPAWRIGVEITLALLVFVLLASVVGYLLAFWNFRLTRHGGTVHISRGLLTTRATSIEERRLRGAELSEPLLLRWVHGARVIVIATGLRVGRGAERGGTVLMPPGPAREAVRVSGEVIAQGLTGAADPFTATLLAHGPRATRRRYTRALSVAALLGIALGLVLQLAAGTVLGWIALPVLLLGAAGLAADRARSLGHGLVSGYLVTRFGALVRRCSALAVDGVIGWTWRSSVFQRRAGLVTLTATSAAGRQAYHVQDVPLCESLRLADAVSPGLLEQFRVASTPGQAHRRR